MTPNIRRTVCQSARQSSVASKIVSRFGPHYRTKPVPTWDRFLIVILEKRIMFNTLLRADDPADN